MKRAEQFPQISDAEFCVMQALWKLGKATAGELVEEVSRTRAWNPKTIRTLLNRLVSKGAANAQKTDAKAYLYYPVIAQDDYVAHESHHFLDKLYQGSLGLMLSHFVSETPLSSEEIAELKAILEEADHE
ncbi:MAG: BlaI/MecI/CopY family transcriptional regulator [Ruminococcaceae bacterium]|nr:BlaI/MecI/CopY family transcriptional regulator [Oscillospiraceae bacterium]